MKIIVAFPPNYGALCKAFNIAGMKTVVFTYGDILFNPGNVRIDPALMIHEQTHEKQQAEIGVKDWWDKYISNSKFRFSQELEAYRNQYAYIQKNYPRKDRRRYETFIAKSLSGPIYGNLCSYEEALAAIQ